MKLTLLLIAANILIFFYSLTDYQYFLQNFGFSKDNFLAGNYYTIITSMFLHGDLTHLTGNMIALFFLGITVERNAKLWQYALVYFASGVVANLSLFIPLFGYGDIILIGASGAISGLVGFGTFVMPGKFVIFPTAIPIPFIVAGAIYLLATVSNLFVPTYIAYPAHLFGIFGGAVFGLIWGENRIKRLSAFILLLLLVSGLPFVLGYGLK